MVLGQSAAALRSNMKTLKVLRNMLLIMAACLFLYQSHMAVASFIDGRYAFIRQEAGWPKKSSPLPFLEE